MDWEQKDHDLWCTMNLIFLPFLILFKLISPVKFELSCRNAGSLTPLQLVHHLNGTYFVTMRITEEPCAPNDLNVSSKSLQASHTRKKRNFYYLKIICTCRKILGRKGKAWSKTLTSQRICWLQNVIEKPCLCLFCVHFQPWTYYHEKDRPDGRQRWGQYKHPRFSVFLIHAVLWFSMCHCNPCDLQGRETVPSPGMSPLHSFTCTGNSQKETIFSKCFSLPYATFSFNNSFRKLLSFSSC